MIEELTMQDVLIKKERENKDSIELIQKDMKKERLSQDILIKKQIKNEGLLKSIQEKMNDDNISDKDFRDIVRNISFMDN